LDDLCTLECTKTHDPNGLAADLTFRLRLRSEFGARDPWTPTYTDDVGFPIGITHTTTPGSMGAGMQFMDVFASVQLVDDALGIEPWIFAVGGNAVGADTRPPWPAVPLPSALSLFLIALVGLVFLSWRRDGRLMI
jgi:hypothetical protein